MDYGKFSLLEGNREIRRSHVEELKRSMQKHKLDKAIDVNEKFEIVDGQHRFTAWHELKRPIIYIIHKGWGSVEVPVLNSKQKNWNPYDYVDQYIVLGVEDYKRYKEFAQAFGFPHNTNLILLQGGSRNNADRDFVEGNFKILKWTWANLIANNLVSLKDVYPGYKRFKFVSAYIRIQALKGFEHKVLLGKLAYQSRKLVDCTTVDEYFELLREIYNYKSQSSTHRI